MTFKDLKLRLRALFSPRKVETELDEELAFHLEAETAKLVASGHSPAEARRLALSRFGPVALAADECRDARGIAFVDNVVRDVVYALRTFRRAPLPALTIVGTLSLGLGMVAVAFSFYNTMVFRTDAVPQVEELYQINLSPPGKGSWSPFTRPQYERLRRETDAFSGVMAVLPQVNVRTESRAMDGALVTGNFFEVLDVNATLGRRFASEEDEPVIVLSHRAWTRFYDADPAVVGRTLALNGSPVIVIGIMPEGFRGLEFIPPDFWMPLSRLTDVRPTDRGREDSISLPYVIGRLRQGVSPEAATAQLDAWAGNIEGLLGTEADPRVVALVPRLGTFFTDASDALVRFTPLFLVFGLVLVIGCANVANLLLARGITRQRELGIRLSLGASRVRIVRQLVTESLLLAMAAVAGGIVVSRIFLEGATRLSAATLPPWNTELLLTAAPADWRVLLFLFGAAVSSTMIFALLPAIRATRPELVRSIRGEVVADARPGLSRHALIALQVAASALLLITASVFLKSAFDAAAAEPGVRVAETVFVTGLTEQTRPAVIQAARSEPSVTAVAAVFPANLRGNNTTATMASEMPDGQPPPETVVELKLVSHEYFDLVGLGVQRGRVFLPEERAASSGVVVISERTAADLWPGQDAVGQRVRLEPWESRGVRSGEGTPDPTPPMGEHTVIGVVPHVRIGFGNFALYTAGAYLPTTLSEPGTSLALRVRGDSDLASTRLSNRLSELDPSLGSVRALAASAGRGVAILRTGFWLTMALGSLALLLTVSGVFGVLSYLVEQRRREIGVRMALGARPGEVLLLVLRQSLRPVLAGLMVGGAFAGTLATALLALPAAMRVGDVVRIYDPIPYAAGFLCIAVPCVLAACVPAWRAARIDPIAALRSD